MLLHRFRRMTADCAVQSDRAGLALQPACLTHRRDEERVVRGGGDADVEVFVANTVGLCLDEGSRHVTLRHNVIQDAGVWAFTNASGTNNTNDSTFSENWYNTGATQMATGPPHNNA
ncbi:hypothetical protein SSPO_005400 [Streptomyces antimycoticus]|uniref:Right handed beta helix domain-containing protein n=1 Tax=Streptomyces antimycoticus TaxID=68175 RepID=A0A499UCJ6_9ACTN|nr:hypothetical protein SSPO_005400 [Streptomyces antimycoticus]